MNEKIEFLKKYNFIINNKEIEFKRKEDKLILEFIKYLNSEDKIYSMFKRFKQKKEQKEREEKRSKEFNEMIDFEDSKLWELTPEQEKKADLNFTFNQRRKFNMTYQEYIEYMEDLNNLEPEEY